MLFRSRICRKHDFHNFKFSMKSSNPKVMIECYRLLTARLAQEGPDWNYPLHLGVTEAGEGEDGRIKSAIGIGSLLCDGIGDTIRVSLTEDSPREIAVCDDLLSKGVGLVRLTKSYRSVPNIQHFVNAAFATDMTGDGHADYVPLEQHREDIAGRPSVIAPADTR